MSPELTRELSARVRPFLVGLALAVVAFAGGSLLLYEAGGALPAAAGLLATFAAALAAGLWAGAPVDDAEAPPAGRWILLGIALGFAGMLAWGWTRIQAERLGGAARALGLLFIVGVPVYAAGYLLPALTAWEGARDVEEDGEVDPGLAPTAVITAVLGGVAVGAALCGLFLLPQLAPGTLLLVVAALVTFPAVYPYRARGEATEQHLLAEEQTPFGTIRVVEIVYPGKRQPERRLYQNDEIESGELTRTGAPTFAYIAAGERLFAALERPGLAYLFLGGGAFTLPRRIVEREPEARITVVELDPEVTRVAYRWFGLRPEHGIHTIHGDARLVASELPGAAYDRVFVDVYDGTETVPYHLVTLEAFGELSRLLKPGGVVAVNVIGVAEGGGDRRFWSTVRTAQEAFGSVRLYYHLSRDFPDRQNFLLVGSPDANAPFPDAAGTFEPWPEAEWPRLPGTTVFRDRFGDPPDTRAALHPPAVDDRATTTPQPAAAPHPLGG